MDISKINVGSTSYDVKDAVAREAISNLFGGSSSSEPSVNNNGYDYVEIGGVKWATMNVGASSITDAGLYFQWGDTQGYTAAQVGSGSGQKYFGWTDYKYNNGGVEPTAENMTKYNSSDGKTVLEASDDAVQDAWGGSWRMPTADEYAALCDAVNSEWTSNYQGSGVAGLVLTDKTDSSKTLFFPAAGYCNGGSVDRVGRGGYYWSSSVYSSDVQGAYNLFFNSGRVRWQDNDGRCFGFAVRGILDDSTTPSDNTSLHKVAVTGDYNDLENKPTIPDAQIQSDWNLTNTSSKDYIKNKPSSMPASDVSAWAKASSKPSYNLDEVSDGSTRKLADKIGKTINTTWANLKSLRDNSQLVPGQFYRITDYQCTTSQENTQSAGHAFDVIVRADDVNVLNENAYAALHAGDTYFANSKLEAWELKYCLDNINWSLQIIPPTYKIGNNTWSTAPSKGSNGYYRWNRQNGESYYTESLENGAAAYFNHGSMVSSGNTLSIVSSDEEGFGTITWMKDENDNECPYDFKNVMFKPGAKEQAGTVGGVFYYTFSVATGTNDAIITDRSLNGIYCYGNKMGKYIYENKHQLNANVFRNTSSISNCYSNTFGNSCNSNTFGNSCNSNTFGNSCYSNTFGNSCSYNTFGNSCTYNTFGIDCNNNTFGIDYGYNTFGNSCSYNTFGERCNNNTFGERCTYNTFGIDCNNNTFGERCYYNTFGNSCVYIIFGTSSSTKNYCRYIIVENGNKRIYLDCSATTSSSYYFQNVKITQGVNNTSTYKTITHATAGDTFQTIYQPANSQVISV